MIESAEYQRLATQIKYLRERNTRLELLMVAVIECLQTSQRWHKATSDVWEQSSTELEQSLHVELQKELRQ